MNIIDIVEEKPTAPTESIDPITKQLEFYFSDTNLWKSKFMKDQMKEDPLQEGYIKISIVQKCNRVKNCSIEQIQEAVRNSQHIVLSPDGNAIKRSKPLPPFCRSAIDRRTIYIDHLPKDITHEQIQQIFEKFGQVVYVSLPTQIVLHDEKEERIPKGFAFIEFSEELPAKNALEFDGEKIGDREVLVISKKAWLLNVGTKREGESHGRNARENRKRQRNEGTNYYKYEKEPEPQGKVLKFTEVGNIEKKDLAKIFKNVCKFAHLDFKTGDSGGYLRVNSSEDAQALHETLDNKKEIGQSKIQLTLLTDEEQQQYIHQVVNNKKKHTTKHTTKDKTTKPKQHIVFSDSETDSEIETSKITNSIVPSGEISDNEKTSENEAKKPKKTKLDSKEWKQQKRAGKNNTKLKFVGDKEFTEAPKHIFFPCSDSDAEEEKRSDAGNKRKREDT